MMNALRNLCVMVYCRLQSFAKEEKGAVDIVAIVIMIGIAVLLAILFRTQIENLLNTLFDTITQSATDAVS